MYINIIGHLTKTNKVLYQRKTINLYKLLSILIILLSAIGCTSPNDNHKETPEIPIEIPLQDININIDKILFINEDKNILINYFPSDTTDKELEYSSSNNEILSIDTNGKITPKNKGTARITVRSKNNEIISKSENVSVYQIVSKSSIINTSEQWGPYEKIVRGTSDYLGINTNVEIIITNNTLYR